MVVPMREVSGHVLVVLKALLACSIVPNWQKVFSTYVAIWEVPIQKLFAEVEKLSFIQKQQSYIALTSFLVKRPVCYFLFRTSISRFTVCLPLI